MATYAERKAVVLAELTGRVDEPASEVAELAEDILDALDHMKESVR